MTNSITHAFDKKKEEDMRDILRKYINKILIKIINEIRVDRQNSYRVGHGPIETKAHQKWSIGFGGTHCHEWVWVFGDRADKCGLAWQAWLFNFVFNVGCEPSSSSLIFWLPNLSVQIFKIPKRTNKTTF